MCMLNKPRICKECGSTDLLWHDQVTSFSLAVDGRLKLEDCRVLFYLGCETCSATLAVHDGGVIADALNDMRPKPTLDEWSFEQVAIKGHIIQGIKDPRYTDSHGLQYNVAWRNTTTGEVYNTEPKIGKVGVVRE